MKTQDVIPFDLGFKPKDLKDVRHSRSTTDAGGNVDKTTIDLPIFPLNGTNAMLVHVVTKWKAARTILGWTNGEKCYANFSKQLESTLEWDVIKDPFPISVAGCLEAINAFVQSKFPADAWQIHRDMMENTKKPFNMSPSQFLIYLKFHNKTLDVIPGYPANGPERKFTDYEMRNLFFKAQPASYQRDFRKAGRTVAASVLADMEAYFQFEYEVDPTVNAFKTGSDSGGRKPSSNNNTNRSRPTPGRGYTGGTYRGGRFGSFNRPGFRSYNGPGRQGFSSGRGYGYGSYQPFGNRGTVMAPRQLFGAPQGGRFMPSAGRFGGRFSGGSTGYGGQRGGTPGGRGNGTHGGGRTPGGESNYNFN